MLIAPIYFKYKHFQIGNCNRFHGPKKLRRPGGSQICLNNTLDRDIMASYRTHPSMVL